MGATRQESLETDALIAPGEVRELIARLTEQSVEAVPSYKARTLEGLALETGLPVARLRSILAEMRGRKAFTIPPAAWVGFVLLALLTDWIVLHPAPGQVPAPVAAAPEIVPAPDLSGTLSLEDVTYGPDAGLYSVVPGFEPTNPLPEGLSIAATAGNVLWGSGDHRAATIEKPFTPAMAEAIRADVVELLKYVRDDADRRRVPKSPPPFGTGIAKPTKDRTVTLKGYTYYGTSSEQVQLPPPGPDGDKAVERAIDRAADRFVESLQEQLRRWMDMRRGNGP